MFPKELVMTREPAVAGKFYSASANTLLREIESYLKRSDCVYDAKAIVAPHAGYMYSGAVAGAVYGSVRLPRRFIVLGPNHTGMGVPRCVRIAWLMRASIPSRFRSLSFKPWCPTSALPPYALGLETIQLWRNLATRRPALWSRSRSRS